MSKVTDEQIRLSITTIRQWSATEPDDDYDAFRDSVNAGKTLVEAIRQGNDRITALEAKCALHAASEAQAEQELVGARNDALSYKLQRDQLAGEIAELRKPVAVGRNPAVEEIRAKAARWTQAEIDDLPEDHVLLQRLTLLSAYDTLAQDLTRANSAHDVHMAEIAGLRERQQLHEKLHKEQFDISEKLEFERDAAQERERQLRKALERIAKWFGEFPSTGKTWPDGTPVSYSAEFGSNGERDYMRGIAIAALSPQQPDGAKAQHKSHEQLREECFGSCSDYSCVRIGTCTGKESGDGPV